MEQEITVGEGQNYEAQVDEKQNKNQFNSINNPQEVGNDNNIIQQYPVDIKQSSDISNSEEDPIIKAQLRNGFIRKVFGIVTFQLIFSFLFILICNTKVMKKLISHYQTFWILLTSSSILCFIICICVLTCNRRLSRKVPHNYILLFLITLSESILCTTGTFQYSYDIVVASILLTIAASLGIIIYTMRTKRDLSGCGMALMVFVSQLFFFGFINLFIRSKFLDMLYTLGATALFGMYLVYDVQLISGKYGNEYSIDDFVFASMELYIDIIRLFLQILKILGKLQKNN